MKVGLKSALDKLRQYIDNFAFKYKQFKSRVPSSGFRVFVVSSLINNYFKGFTHLDVHKGSHVHGKYLSGNILDSNLSLFGKPIILKIGSSGGIMENSRLYPLTRLPNSVEELAAVSDTRVQGTLQDILDSSYRYETYEDFVKARVSNIPPCYSYTGNLIKNDKIYDKDVKRLSYELTKIFSPSKSYMLKGGKFNLNVDWVYSVIAYEGRLLGNFKPEDNFIGYHIGSLSTLHQTSTTRLVILSSSANTLLGIASLIF